MRGRTPLRLGLAGGTLVGRVQDRHRAPHHIGRLVTEHALRRGVPRHDAPCRIEQEHGVVLHPVDDQAQPFLALLELGFMAPTLGEITGHL